METTGETTGWLITEQKRYKETYFEEHTLTDNIDNRFG